MMTMTTGNVTLDATLWSGPDTDKERPVRVQRPCPCGCDLRDGPLADGRAVGYVTGSDPQGNGFTIYLPDEATYAMFAAIFGERD